MEKEELCSKLKEKGYNAKMEDNIPYVYYTDEKSPFEKVYGVVRAMGYTGSFGVKKRSQSKIGVEK